MPNSVEMAKAEEEIILAVARIKLIAPSATAKEVWQKLASDQKWSDTTLSQVKRACSKAAKRCDPRQECRRNRECRWDRGAGRRRVPRCACVLGAG